jgi:hypothetical protein
LQRKESIEKIRVEEQSALTVVSVPRPLNSPSQKLMTLMGNGGILPDPSVGASLPNVIGSKNVTYNGAGCFHILMNRFIACTPTITQTITKLAIPSDFLQYYDPLSYTEISSMKGADGATMSPKKLTAMAAAAVLSSTQKQQQQLRSALRSRNPADLFRSQGLMIN